MGSLLAWRVQELFQYSGLGLRAVRLGLNLLMSVYGIVLVTKIGNDQ